MNETNFRAWVSKPNTPESDLEEYVPHIVNYEVEGKTVVREIMAADPIDAIEKVKNEIKAETT